MIHTDQIPQSCGDTYIVCVCLVSRYQIEQFDPFSVSPIIFYAGGRYKLLNQWKWVFHVVIPHEFQSRGKIMKNWWFLMYLSIPDTWVNWVNFWVFFSGSRSWIGAPIKFISQYSCIFRKQPVHHYYLYVLHISCSMSIRVCLDIGSRSELSVVVVGFGSLVHIISGNWWWSS